MTGQTIPDQVRLRLAHAAVQCVADRAGADVIHVKGLSLDPVLVWEGRQGTDVDVVVRPAHLEALLRGLRSAGWRLETGFDQNSAFGHAATYWHDMFGYVDVHRHYPGLGGSAARAFDGLLRHTVRTDLGGRPCVVPTVAAQRLVLLLHAGRGRSGKEERDVEQAWGRADAATRAEVEALADELDARLGLAAALGHLDAFADDRRYELWRVASKGGTRLDEWRARVAAAETPWEAVKLVLRAPLVNVQHLAAVLRRPPTRAEVVREFFARPLRGLREEVARRRGPR